MNQVHCFYCKKGTQRGPVGWCTKTLSYFPPRYDENGKNLNPDRNICSQEFYCNNCDDCYVVQGNRVDGYQAYKSRNCKEEVALRAKEREEREQQMREQEELKREQERQVWERTQEQLKEHFFLSVRIGVVVAICSVLYIITTKG